MKTKILFISIFILLAGIFSPIFYARAVASCSLGNINNKADCELAGGTWGDPTSGTNTQYKLLAPLPCPTGTVCNNGNNIINVGENGALGNYLNLLIKLIIGISAVLAVVMIVMGGIEYMGSELISSKEAGKERIQNAILGLLIALSAWALLNTINPDLLKSDPVIPGATVTITLDQANFAKTEKTTSSVGSQYVVGTTSSGVTDFVKNGAITGVNVDTSTKTATFCNGSQCVSVPINIGYNGVAQPGQAQPGDAKTPIGTSTIGGNIIIGSNGNAVVQNGYNFGAAFVNLGITDSSGNDRGIGFHGSYNDSLGTTNGCIRMNNADLLALAPYMKSGLKVTIH